MNPVPVAKKQPSRFSAYPLLWLSAFFAAGIACSNLVTVDGRISLLAVFAFGIAAAFSRDRSYAVVFIAGAFFLLGAFCLQFETNGIRADRLKRIYDEGRIESGDPVEIEGVLIARPEAAYEGAFLRIDSTKLLNRSKAQSASGVAKLFVPISDIATAGDFDALELRRGSRVRVACNLTREDEFLNPGVMPRRQILDQQGIDASATVKSPLLIEKLGDESWFSPFDLVYEQRQRLIDAFRERFDSATAGVMIASLLGDKYFLDKNTADVFRDGGTFHVLIISGLHITFIGGLVFWLIRRFTSNRVLQFAIVCSFLWAYTFAVGAEVPVVRASIMFTILLLSRVIYRNGTLLNALGLSCLTLLIWRPSDLFNASFQLTIVSVAAIVTMGFHLIEKLRAIGSWSPDTTHPFPAFVPRWLKRSCEMLYWREAAWEIELGRQIWSAKLFKQPYLKWLEAKGIQPLAVFLFEGVLISLIVQLWLLPLLIYYFHRVSPISILLNLWVGVIIALESFAAIIAIVAAQISETLAIPIIRIAEILNWLLISVPRVFTDLDWASFRVPIYSGPMKPIYGFYMLPVVLLAFAVYRWDPFNFRDAGTNRRLRLWSNLFAAGSTAILAALIVFHPYTSPRPDGKLRIDFLDVGQGDAAFITFPNGETMLIDGGGRVDYTDNDEGDGQPFEPDVPRIGEMVVSEFLWEKGYSRVDHVVATHADADHVQGLADVVRNFEVGTLYVGQMPDEASEIDPLIKESARFGVEPKAIGRGDVLEIGGARIEILWPIKMKLPSQSDNNGSIVMRVIYGKHSILLTGDIEREAEAALTANGTVLNAMVVKVPHHGSRTSSTVPFVDAVNARYAIISVGKRSMFGHPNSDVVGRWVLAGAETLTTGSKGTITVSMTGSGLEISQFKQ